MHYDTLRGRGSRQSYAEWRGIDPDEEYLPIAAAAAVAATVTTDPESQTIQVLTGGFRTVEDWAGSLDTGVEELTAQNADDLEADRETHVNTTPHTD